MAIFINKVILECPLCGRTQIDYVESLKSMETLHDRFICPDCQSKAGNTVEVPALETQNALLESLIKKRDEFLKKNPSLIPLQNEITRILDQTRPENRVEVVGIMMANKVTELNKALKDIHDLLKIT